MPNLGGWEIVAILAVLVLLFGAKKLPDAARGIGRSLRIFKAEIKDPSDEEGRDSAAPVGHQPAITPPPVQPVVQAPPAAPVQPAQEQVQYVQPAQPVQQPTQPSSTER